MGVKLNGAQFKAFWASDWGLGEPGAFYADDVSAAVNGVMTDDIDTEKLKDNDSLNVLGGVIFHGEDARAEIDLVSFIRKWLKLQKTAYFTVEVPVEDAEEFRLHLKAFPSAVGIKW